MPKAPKLVAEWNCSLFVVKGLFSLLSLSRADLRLDIALTDIDTDLDSAIQSPIWVMSIWTDIKVTIFTALSRLQCERHSLDEELPAS